MTRQELQDKLYKHGGRCGIIIPSEWVELVAQLHTELLELDPNYVIEQVKEKFDGLRFYATPTTACSDAQKFWDLISEAERKSYDIG